MRFLYLFGYQTPQQVAAQRANEWWDDEDSWAFYIEAEDRDAAYAWGRTIAEEFVRRLYAPESVSWSALDYADGIEVPSETITGAFEVRVGQHPSYDEMLRQVRERGAG